ncbi:MAG: hypothetical protein R2847_12020 [Bacteroidia bacterium]
MKKLLMVLQESEIFQNYECAGISNIVEFNLDADLEAAANDVRDKKFLRHYVSCHRILIPVVVRLICQTLMLSFP